MGGGKGTGVAGGHTLTYHIGVLQLGTTGHTHFADGQAEVTEVSYLIEAVDGEAVPWVSTGGPWSLSTPNLFPVGAN